MTMQVVLMPLSLVSTHVPQIFQHKTRLLFYRKATLNCDCWNFYAS